MSGIRTTTGLISGIDIGGLVDSLIAAERAPAARLESRLKNTQTVMQGIGQLQAQLLGLSTSVSTLNNRQTFTRLSIQNSGSDQLTVTSKSTSLAGNYQFQSVQLSSYHRSLSRGFANADVQQIGQAGTLTLTREGSLLKSTRLDLLNEAQGVRRGTIRITDRSGTTADVDLKDAITWDDVVSKINAAGIGVEARTANGRLVLKDTTGQTATNLSVAEVAGGKTAADLGIAQSVASSTLTGDDVFEITEDFTLSLLNDGNGLANHSGVPDLNLTFADGTSLQVNLDGSSILGHVVNAINNDENNSGRVTAELQNGRLVLTDTTTGSGTFSVSNLNGSNATSVLGLENASSGGVITGDLLAAGNSVLLRNLRGGRGVTQLGEISLTDRTGATATVDLSAAESLDDVLEAINTATTSGSVPLQLTARRNAAGTGIEIVDTSGATTSNLVVADVGAGTTAADLGIAVDSASSSVNSGPLRLRTVNEATSLSTYSPTGGAVSRGAFRITDSAGNQAVVNITSTETTLGDVIDRINAATGIQITARLNDTGDGMVIVDDAAGTGQLSVSELGGKTAADLRLLGTSAVGNSGSLEINSRRVQIVDVVSTNTVNDVIASINRVGGTIKAAAVNSGAVVNGTRLSLTSTVSGSGGQFFVEESGVEFNVATQDRGVDGVLRVGSDPATAFLLTSSSNTFTNVNGNFDVTLKQVGTTTANVSATLDSASISAALQSFVTAYNAYVDLSSALTSYDSSTQTRSALQGLTSPLTIQTRFNSLINTVTGSRENAVRSLADVGIVLTTGGKLTFDSTRLESALSTAPDQVQSLFSDPTNGFSTRFSSALDAFNDVYTGSLTREYTANEQNAEQLIDRIAAIDDHLAVRRVRLEMQFMRMETVLSGLQSQQTALSGLTTVIENLKSSSS